MNPIIIESCCSWELNGKGSEQRVKWSEHFAKEYNRIFKKKKENKSGTK